MSNRIVLVDTSAWIVSFKKKGNDEELFISPGHRFFGGKENNL